MRRCTRRVMPRTPAPATKIIARVLLPRAAPGRRAHACLRRGSGSPLLRKSSLAFYSRACSGYAASGERAHACLRRGSGFVARPLTAVLRLTGGAISTTDRRLTTRPCNLSRAEPSPRRCAARWRCAWDRPEDGSRVTHFRSRGWLAAGHGVSSVYHRIAIDRRCHLHGRSTLYHPAVQFISCRTQPASLRYALPPSRDQMANQPVNFTAARCYFVPEHIEPCRRDDSAESPEVIQPTSQHGVSVLPHRADAAKRALAVPMRWSRSHKAAGRSAETVHGLRSRLRFRPATCALPTWVRIPLCGRHARQLQWSVAPP